MLIGIDAHSLEGKRTGVGRVLFNILKQWEKAGSEAQFILYFKDKIPDDLPRGGNFSAKLLNSGSTAKFIHWNLWRAAKRDKLDILFCPEYVGPLFYRGKIAVFLHDISYEARPEEFDWQSPADRILLKWVSKKIARRADLVFTPLEFDKSEIIKYYGVDPEKIIVTGEGVDLIFSEAQSQDSPEVLKKYGISGRFIFFVGSIFLRRHLPSVIKAFLKMREECQDLQFLICGKDRTDSRGIDKMAEQINKRLGTSAILRNNFIGDSELSSIYRNCEFLIWLSDYEGFGLPVAEAMACGVPVMTTDGTSLREVAGQAAYLIKNNSDAGEIYKGMKMMLEDSNLRQELIVKGREQVKKFRWESCAETILRSVKSLK